MLIYPIFRGTIFLILYILLNIACLTFTWRLYCWTLPLSLCVARRPLTAGIYIYISESNSPFGGGGFHVRNQQMNKDQQSIRRPFRGEMYPFYGCSRGAAAPYDTPGNCKGGHLQFSAISPSNSNPFSISLERYVGRVVKTESVPFLFILN